MGTFAANYAGRCRAEDCTYGDGRIRVGDSVTYLGDELMHAECAASQSRFDAPLCKSCNTFHRGDCL
jgi:hypothetical protein